jgi:hypothetical protein
MSQSHIVFTILDCGFWILDFGFWVKKKRKLIQATSTQWVNAPLAIPLFS